MRLIKSRGMRWEEHVTHMGEMRNANKIFVGKPEDKSLLGRLGADGRIILRWNLKKYGVKFWTGFSWLRIGSSYRILCTLS
jgi:hypothetical protein